MKPLFTFFTALLLTMFTSAAQAQKQFTDGSLLYNISISSDKDETAITNSLNGATLSVYLSPTQSRTEMKSTLGIETTVYDRKRSSGFILKEYSGQKLMISMDGDNWNDKNKIYENLQFNISNELVEIAGYKCKKATAQLPDGKMFTVFFNPALSLANKTYNNAFPQLNGLPVQYELQSGNINFKYTLSLINNENVPVAKFDAPKSGFRVMTYDENQQLKRNN